MKSTKRFRTHLALGVVAVIAAAHSHSLSAAETDAKQRHDLSGTVQNQDAQPIRNATVFIYTAGPKEGPGILCPSCYADCRKRTTTDASGKFIIESLDPDLLFRVLVVAEDCQPTFVSKVDPAVKPIVVTLKPARHGETSDKRIQGRVVDSDGKPIAGAVINIRGVTRAESTRFGGNDDIDPLAVSDDSGSFAINGTDSFDAAGVDVEARGFAKAVFQSLTTGNTNHTLKLTEGAALKGRVVKGGQPLAGVEVGVAGAERNSEVFVGDFSVGTDKDGRFLLANLPARTKYFFYGVMKSLGDRGCIPARSLETAEDGAILDIGDVEVIPAAVVAGQIRLHDGKPIAPKSRVLLGREEAWDTLQQTVDETGHFRFVGVPPELVSLSARVNGYRLSERNASLDPMNPFHLIGLIVKDKTDLVIDLEPGKQLTRLDGDYQAAREQPLRGAESAGVPNPDDIKVSGTVVDAETLKPIPAFTVTEGRAQGQGPDPNQITWFDTHKTDESNGTYTVYLSKQQRPPAVLIEAEGYLPQSSDLLAGETNFNVSLQKGSGPTGVVLKPDGRPAANVTVYLADMKNGVYVGDSSLKVREGIYRGTRSTTTDTNGHFSFAPRIDNYAIVVVDDAGFAMLTVKELENDSEVQLQPYGHIDGKLMIGSRPGSKESVRLSLDYPPYTFHPRDFPPLSLFLTTTSDKDGNFSFERVPPVAVQVYHEPKVRDGKMGTIAESQTKSFLLEPGETRHLQLGGKGRPVVGRLVVSNYDGEINYRADVQSIYSIIPQPPEMPDLNAISKEFAEKYRALTSDEEKKAALAENDKNWEAVIEKTAAFYRTDAGRQYHFAHRRFALNFSQDGSFRIEDVPAGKYELRIELREGSGDSPSRLMSPAIANLTKEINVPDSSERPGDVFDLGAIPLMAHVVLRPGKTAPNFAVKTLDDKPLKLSDFKGKYVLLDFWATWCGPCVAETPNLKATWDAFEDDPRFAMVGLSLDNDADAPRKYAAKNQIGWTQGFLGDWAKTDVPASFGVDGIPAIFLIGPDGKIKANGLRGEQIKAEVDSALKEDNGTHMARTAKASDAVNH